MPAPVDQDLLRDAHTRARQAAAHLRLPFHRQSWRGSVGNWMGAGIGSSIDFQDHRPYLPGDDPRYIDWQAYARSGQYIMKLYREEVSPRLDLILDASRSMLLAPEKRRRAFELLYFCVESASRAGASLRAFAVAGERVVILPAEALQSHDFQSLEAMAAPVSRDWKTKKAPLPPPPAPALGRVPLRPGSMRVCVSDLLFPGEPEPLLMPLISAKGRGLLLVPYDATEAAPEWDGNFEFVDCESGAERIQRVEPALRERYAAAYKRHFELWRDTARRYAITFARVPAETELIEALRFHAVASGAVEVSG